MRTLYTCITVQHDLRLLALAAMICLFACFTGVNLVIRARDSVRRRRVVWMSAAAAVLGSGIWATQFVAMLAYDPGVPLGYDVGLTAASFAAALSATWLGLAIVLRYRAWWVGGGIVGAAVGATHFIGVAALRAPGILHWDPPYVIASLAIGIALGALGFRTAPSGSAPHFPVAATLSLVAAICGLHLTAMAGLRFEPDPLVAVSDQLVAPQLLAAAIAAVTVLVIGLGLSASIMEDRIGRQTREAERLRRSEEHLARAQRIAGVGSIQRDFRTGRGEYSEEMLRMFGLSAAPATSKMAFLDQIHPEDRAMVDAAVADTEKGFSVPPIEFRIIRSDGALRWIYREAEVIFDEDGTPIGRLSTFKDVTERRAAGRRQGELERQLLHSQKLEALGTLAGGMAHDLNNALMPILALSKVVMEEMPEGSSAREDLETIMRASERARDLVQRILAFSRKQEMVKGMEKVDLAVVTRETLRMLRATLPAKVQLVESIGEVPPLSGDPGQLQQVIVNLVTNAVQAIGNRSGKITVAVSPSAELLPSARPEGEASAIRLSVADTGSGMDEATLNRIFEPFFTTKNVGEGTGLGLSVAHGIVTGHGGRIDVRSAPGAGTEFTVLLPAWSEDEAAFPTDQAMA